MERVVNVTTDTVSQLETSAAKSIATVAGGQLSHTLENKSTPISVQFVYDTIVRDTTIYIEREREIVREVEKSLNGWQRFRLQAFYSMAVALMAVAAFAVYKIMK